MNVKNLKLLSAAIGMIFCSCNNDPVLEKEGFQNVNGRIVFENKADAIQQLSTLSKKSEEELVEWEKQNNLTSLRSTIDYHSETVDTLLLYFPPALASILNTQKEYQVGDSIIWFHENNVFKLPADEALLMKVKNNPSSREFASLREDFINRGSVTSSVNGRQIPNSLSTTTWFRLGGTLDYRFARDLRITPTGVNYIIELVNCLQYKSSSNSLWYLAGERVNLKTIGNIRATPESGFTWFYDKSYGEAYDHNDYLRINIINSSRPFAGSVKATFRHEIYTASTGWITFYEDVTWY